MDIAATSPTTVPAGRRRPGAESVLAAAAALLSALVFLVVRGSLIDDAYITLSYARNLAENFQWGLTEFRTANSATSPLNVLALGAATVVVRDAVWGLGLLFVLLNTLQAWGLARLARSLDLSRVWAALAYALVLCSPLMLSIVGMEMTLAGTLMVWLTLSAVEGRTVAFGLLTGALVLTRIDLGVFPLVLLLAVAEVRRRAAVVVGVAALCVAPWYLFSWFALGALVPDTLIIKTISSSSWGPWQFANGPLLYLDRFPGTTVLAAAPAAIGGVGLVLWLAGRLWRLPRWRGLGPLAALAVGGLAHYLAYSLLGPPPFHWYYAPSAMALTFAGVLGLGRIAVPASDAAPARPAPRALAAAAVTAVLVVDVVAVLGRPVPWSEVPITTNWATAAQYQRIGEDLAELTQGEVVRSPGEIGALAYHCRCDIVDPFSDRGTLLGLLGQLEGESGPLMRLVLKVNFLNLDRDVPPAEPTVALVYRAGPGLNAQWLVGSAWRGPGGFSLTEDLSLR